MTSDSGTWVYDPEEVSLANTTGMCPCGEEDTLKNAVRFSPHLWCSTCNRHFAMQGHFVVSPDDILATPESGLISFAPQFMEELSLLIEMTGEAADHIELSMPDYKGVLYARDGVIVGYFIYEPAETPTIHAIGIASGYRREGYGTDFLETWFQSVNASDLTVDWTTDVGDFCCQLDIPVDC